LTGCEQSRNFELVDGHIQDAVRSAGKTKSASIGEGVTDLPLSWKQQSALLHIFVQCRRKRDLYIHSSCFEAMKVPQSGSRCSNKRDHLDAHTLLYRQESDSSVFQKIRRPSAVPSLYQIAAIPVPELSICLSGCMDGIHSMNCLFSQLVSYTQWLLLCFH
jgi:hypothetical protein